MAQDKRLKERFEVRVKMGEKKAYQKASKALGQSPSEWARAQLNRSAGVVAEAQEGP